MKQTDFPRAVKRPAWPKPGRGRGKKTRQPCSEDNPLTLSSQRLGKRGNHRLFIRLKCYLNCKRKRRFFAITYYKIKSSLHSAGGSILSRTELVVFLLVLPSGGRFYLQFEMLPKRIDKNPYKKRPFLKGRKRLNQSSSKGVLIFRSCLFLPKPSNGRQNLSFRAVPTKAKCPYSDFITANTSP